jgi:hypothetical protein
MLQKKQHGSIIVFLFHYFPATRGIRQILASKQATCSLHNILLLVCFCASIMETLRLRMCRYRLCERRAVCSRLRNTTVINRLLSNGLGYTVPGSGMRRLRAICVNMCKRVPEQVGAILLSAFLVQKWVRASKRRGRTKQT